MVISFRKGEKGWDDLGRSIRILRNKQARRMKEWAKPA